ncbi:hypothetical protein TNCV_499691 [Trichonephila clavipes]|nr:hypothetical protein TNCV_499691 [Trichonephila clavipes]
MADLLPLNRVLPKTTSQRGDTSQVLSSMRSPSSALVAPFNRLIYSQILTRWKYSDNYKIVPEQSRDDLEVDHQDQDLGRQKIIQRKGGEGVRP